MARGRTSDDEDKAARAGLAAALRVGGGILQAGGAALDAVEAAVRVLEDDPAFNAGRGAVFTTAGTHELDAAIMDGATRCAGAVAGVTRTRNPVSLARAVMRGSKHVMLVGSGADDFARQQGVEQVDPSYFSTEQRRAQLERMHGRFDSGVKFGTVGAVARDITGRLAAATSTGGLTGKRPGRVGDTPVIGAGTYADDRACAVSATGSGEYYLRVGVAHEICARVRLLGETVQAAADAVQAETHALGGDGGVIVVAPDGTPAWSFTTPGMYRGLLRDCNAPVVAIYGDE
ncbi:MAG: isoaspartyl peptidase/L-asparaginase [Sphingomonadaceae bacterium]|nr:isoaspartyl peptidase/L-asparaginase [Sphingomonadaceae bacterium]